MKRTHILLRLFVLAAMMLSFGEALWASTCASMSMVAAADAAASSDAMPDMPGMPAEGEQREGDGPSCPLAPAAVAPGCLTAASLPATSAAGVAAGDERTADIDFVAMANERIYGTPLFHPPRA
ncbi:MAG: hypothetical protein ACRELT_06960 [Longimicrobiales bacterium]